MFLFVYLAANHFPWSYRFRPDLAPQWQDLATILRRSTNICGGRRMSAQDYAGFLARLKQNFPASRS